MLPVRALMYQIQSYHGRGSIASIRSVRSAGSKSDKSAHEKQTSYVAVTRIISNLVAGALVFLSVVTLAVLLSQNMFARTVVSINSQTPDYFWAPYGQNCLLNAHGFVPNSCSTVEMEIITTLAWSAVGTALAQQWSLELAQANTLYITTCVIGATADVGWGDLQVIAGYTTFPECLPTSGAQAVAGMMMLETTIRSAHPEGVYLMTLYSDLTPAMQSVHENVNTDGSVSRLLENVKRTIITQSGAIEDDPLGLDYIITSRPLGERYLVTEFCHTEIEELSLLITSMSLPGWSQGKNSGIPIVPGWNCGHVVSNSSELIAFQVIFAVLTLVLLSGDLLTTYQGLKGVLGGKPVLTYAILSGLERRKMLLLCIVLNAMPGLLYLDVSRIYFFTDNGFKIWSLSTAMAASFTSFGWFAIVAIVDFLLTPIRPMLGGRCLSYSAPIYMYVSLIAIFLSLASDDTVFRTAYNDFFSAPPYLGMFINNQTWPSGAYVASGTPSVVMSLGSQVITALFASWGAAIAYDTLYRLIAHRRILLMTNWCSTNSFLTQITPPTFLTTLPLEQSNAIKIGNRIFCKPSTMALMGYAAILDSDQIDDSPEKKKGGKEFTIVSIYTLVVAVYGPSWFWKPRAIGKIIGNMFQNQAGESIDHQKKYVYTRGTCVS